MVAMATFWLLGKNGCYERHNFSNFIFSKRINQNNYQNTFSVAMETSLLPQNELETKRTIGRI